MSQRKQGERDLCPGFRANHKGSCGICSCGLYWEKEMPPHDEHQRIVHLDRILKRKVRIAVARSSRDQGKAWFRRCGAERPLGPGMRIVKGGK